MMTQIKMSACDGPGSKVTTEISGSLDQWVGVQTQSLHVSDIMLVMTTLKL